MRYKSINFSTLIIVGLVIYLYFTDSLSLYIHPRYLTFTFIFVAIGAILLSISLFYGWNHKSKRSWAGLLMILCVVFSVAIPETTLSSRLASGRVQQSLVVNSEAQSTIDSFSTDLSQFTIRDWDAFLKTRPSKELFSNKQASVDGFIFKIDSQYFIARYRLTCCAVDATPVILALQTTEDQQLKLTENDWFKISGKTVYIDSAEYPYQLHPESIDIVEPPKEQYVF